MKDLIMVFVLFGIVWLMLPKSKEYQPPKPKESVHIKYGN